MLNNGLDALENIKGELIEMDEDDAGECFSSGFYKKEKELNIIENELKANEFVFKRLNIHVKKVLFDDGTILYELCYAEYASLITEEEYNMLKKCGL